MLKRSIRGSVILCVIALWSVPVDAQMNGHNALGDFGVLSGSQPGPGFYAAGTWSNYQTNQVLDRDGDPLSLLPATDPAEMGIDAFVGLFWWVTDHKILGANYSIMVVPSVANVRLEAPALGRAFETTWGLGDLYVQPVNLGWHRDRADFSAGLGLTAPIGRYDVDADDNIGLGMWTFELSGGASVFFDEAKSWHLATMAFYETHTGKKDSDARVGDLLTLEGGLGKSFRDGLLSVGAAYYAQWKVTADDFGLDFTVPVGTRVGKHEVFGFGPDVTVPILSSTRLIALVNARYLWEFGARTKTQGQALVITATFPIPSIPIA
jgi:hypothetical protein